MRIRSTLAALLLTLLPAAAAAQAGGASQASFDVVLLGGAVMDGTGNPWFYADVGIRDGRIAAIGDLRGADAARTVDARGQLVLPGFIDIHSHADDGARASGGFRDEDARYRAAPNLVAQGVTTVVVNQDGRSPWPIAEQRGLLETNGIGPNAALLIGHGQLRRLALGDDYMRPSTPAEVAHMRALARQGMEEGAFGISAGLEYVPGRWSETDEVVAVVEEIVPWGGVYISHERSEGADPMWYWPSQDEPGPPTLLDAVMETIEIGERTGATVVASHIKAKGAHYWGTSHAVIGLIERARARGVPVYADQYPYATSGSDGSTVLLPRWVFPERRRGEGPVDLRPALREALADSVRARALRMDVAHEIRRRGGAENVVIFDYPDSAWVGRSVADVAALRGVSPVEVALLLQMEGFADRPGGARLRGFSMSEADVEAYAPQAWMATASDAGIALPDDGPVHARYYGTFPRKLRHYALERGALSLEDAVRSMTSLPAQIMGFTDRGVLRAGARADVTVVDLEQLADRATFFEPHQYPAGIEYVLVNGAFVVDGGQLTWALPGRVLTPATDGGRRLVREPAPAPARAGGPAGGPE
ncbi:MAG TPA: amidohydrolase family protein [Longimicrobiales bacterium]|nr:amidohydrolase family protein [Longimicrobiales bacterium]